MSNSLCVSRCAIQSDYVLWCPSINQPFTLRTPPPPRLHCVLYVLGPRRTLTTSMSFAWWRRQRQRRRRRRRQQRCPASSWWAPHNSALRNQDLLHHHSPSSSSSSLCRLSVSVCRSIEPQLNCKQFWKPLSQHIHSSKIRAYQIKLNLNHNKQHRSQALAGAGGAARMLVWHLQVAYNYISCRPIEPQFGRRWLRPVCIISLSFNVAFRIASERSGAELLAIYIWPVLCEPDDKNHQYCAGILLTADGMWTSLNI